MGPSTLTLSSRWHADGPRLPLEFARISADGRLTLVVYQESPLQQTYWAVSSFDTIDGARENLRDREGCLTLVSIHVLTRSGQTCGDILEVVKTNMAAWLALHTDVDAVIWTGLKPNWNEETPFSLETALAYLQSQEGTARSRAREYLTKAPPQIQTPVRQRARSVLSWDDMLLGPDVLA